jgi:hypothetical protein
MPPANTAVFAATAGTTPGLGSTRNPENLASVSSKPGGRARVCGRDARPRERATPAGVGAETPSVAIDSRNARPRAPKAAPVAGEPAPRADVRGRRRDACDARGARGGAHAATVNVDMRARECR